MTTKTIAILASAAFAAAALMPAPASAKMSTGGNSSTHQSQNVQINAKVRQPVKIKLIKCHKYARGGADGSVHWETVCS